MQFSRKVYTLVVKTPDFFLLPYYGVLLFWLVFTFSAFLINKELSMSMQNGLYITPSHSNQKKEEEEKQDFPYRNCEG